MSIVTTFIQAARAELGRPYAYGADGPTAFDCSGLTQYAAAQAGIDLPRTAAAQQTATTPVTTPLPGDLVFWGKPAYHVALYIGGGKVIAAPHDGASVQIQDIWGTPTYGRIGGIGTLPASLANSAGNAADTLTGLNLSSLIDTSGLRTWAIAGGTGLLALVLVAAGLTIATKGDSP